MGYYTDFTLNVEGGATEALIDTLNEVTHYDWEDDLTLYDAKWYDWQKDIREVSKNFPDLLFILEGDGEEQGDQWKAYVKDGKMQICNAIITFEPFNEKEMK